MAEGLVGVKMGSLESSVEVKVNNHQTENVDAVGANWLSLREVIWRGFTFIGREEFYVEEVTEQDHEIDDHNTKTRHACIKAIFFLPFPNYVMRKALS